MDKVFGEQVNSWIALQHTTEYCKRNFILIAANEVLKYFPFLSKIGTFSVGEDAFLNVITFRKIKQVAKQNIAVWYFPQGKHIPQDSLSTSTFSEGIIQLSRQFKACAIIPVGFYYYSFRKPQHAVSIYFGQPKLLLDDIDTTTLNDLFDMVLHCVNQAKSTTLISVNTDIVYPFQIQKHMREEKVYAKGSKK